MDSLHRPLVLGSRGSALALAQVSLTQAALAQALPELRTEVKTFVTRGDQKLDLSLWRGEAAGGKGLFTKELEDSLLAGEIGVAIHSLKDLPGHMPAGLELGAVLRRAPTADVLLSKTPGGLDALPEGSRIGTSSVRRARQLQWLRPDLQIEEWRGNVQTRLRKLAQSETTAAIVLAEAGLQRLGFPTESGALEHEEFRFLITSLADRLLPAIGQGAIALQNVAGCTEVQSILSRINHPPTWIAIRAERELQRLLAGDCTLPVGVRTTLAGDEIHLRAVLFEGERWDPKSAEASGSAQDPEAVAAMLFGRLCGQ